MGLGICVNASQEEVRDELRCGLLRDEDASPELVALFEQAVANLRLTADEKYDHIYTQPGSYYGLHSVREVYARLKGIQTGDNTRYQSDERLRSSHLVWHSDCDGWYLPDDFAEPIWAAPGPSGREAVSIGSSVRLLAELMEIDRTTLDDYTRRAWDAVFVPAVASVYCRQVIRFG